MDKVTDSHLKRNAFLYIRQSSLRQVFENTESTERQYALQQKAIDLGWPRNQIIIIDSDLGQSGASAADRIGFQKLVTEVSLGRAGIVMGLEVSRLARNSTDWHRLLELCALSQTLILDEDGVYNPAHFNDRLLLGLKGTMSEAELHVLRARLLGGRLNKARRGELRIPIPVGFVYDFDNNLLLLPDKQVQESIHYFFETFRRTGSATATVKVFKKEGILFPKEIKFGPQKGEIVWAKLTHSSALLMLHNPRYTGAYCYGRSYKAKNAEGHIIQKKKPNEEWITFIKDAHPGYITWEEFENNQKQLKENTRNYSSEREKTPPREGPALLQGLVICGRCGRRMTIRYIKPKDELLPVYLCQSRAVEHCEPLCQHILGKSIDEAIGKLLIETVTPLTLEVALSVRQELQEQIDQVEQLRKKQVERAQYEADLSRRRYMQVDPNNRMVADELEYLWNEKLKVLKHAHEEYDDWKKSNDVIFDEKIKAKIMALATDFPKLWNDPSVPQRDKKRMVRLIIEDVTLMKDKQITLQIRFKGGANKTLVLPGLLRACDKRKTPQNVIKEIDHLLDEHTLGEIAKILNEKEYKSGGGKNFHLTMLRRIQKDYNIKSRYERLREKGLYTVKEIAKKFNIQVQTVNIWRRRGLLKALAYDDKRNYLYEDPGKNPPVKLRRKGLYIMSSRKNNI